MSGSAAHTSAFYRDVAKNRRLWTSRRDGAYAVVAARGGHSVQPMWSTLSRIRRIIKAVPAYAGSEPTEIGWEECRDEWFPRFRREHILVGVNWSGATASGYDLDADWVQHCIEVEI